MKTEVIDSEFENIKAELPWTEIEVEGKKIEKRKRRKAPVQSASSFPDNTVLPLDFINILLPYLDLIDLLPLRLINRSWNILVSSHLRQSNLVTISVDGDQEGHLEQLLVLLASRIQADIPCVSYKFSIGNGEEECVKKFLDVVGPSIINCTFDLKSSSEINLLALVNTMPNLVSLEIEDTSDNSLGKKFIEHFPSTQLVLPDLNELIFHNDYGGELPIKLNILQGWIQSSPTLELFECQYRLEMRDQRHLLTILKSWQHLKRIAIKVNFYKKTYLNLHNHPNFKMTNTRLHLDIFDISDRFCSNLASNLAQVCKLNSLRFHGTPEGRIELLHQENLDYLRMEELNHFKLSTFCRLNPSSNFPLLKKVTLDFENTVLENVEEVEFPQIIFETVIELQINGDGAFDVAGNPAVPFHDMFPNVLNFGVGGSGILNGRHLQYVRNHFSKITSLSIAFRFDLTAEQQKVVEVPNMDFLFTSGEGVNDKQMKLTKIFGNFNWGLWSFKALRKFEIFSDFSKHLKEIIVGMAKLTASQRMPKLDSLMFHGEVGEWRRETPF